MTIAITLGITQVGVPRSSGELTDVATTLSSPTLPVTVADIVQPRQSRRSNLAHGKNATPQSFIWASSTPGLGSCKPLAEPADAAVSELRAEGDEVKDRTPQAIQAGDLEGVAVAQEAQDVVELGAAGFGAAGVVDVDVLARDAGAGERVELVVGVLVCGGDAGVAEEHASETTSRLGLPS